MTGQYEQNIQLSLYHLCSCFHSRYCPMSTKPANTSSLLLLCFIHLPNISRFSATTQK